jgi:prepilin-type N-terminal cleavage/methylation domain-containing protein
MNSQKGFTLIEIIIAIVILGIILIPLIGVFTKGFTHIMAMGNKTRAIAKAEAVIDYIYAEGTYEPSILTSVFAIDSMVNEELEKSPYNPTKPIYYSVDDYNINGELFKKVTVLVFYQNGNRYITLSALVP